MRNRCSAVCVCVRIILCTDNGRRVVVRARGGLVVRKRGGLVVRVREEYNISQTITPGPVTFRNTPLYTFSPNTAPTTTNVLGD